LNKLASFGGYETSWYEVGQNGPKLVLLHCSLAHGGAWAGVSERLSSTYKIFVPDLPGQGKSQDWDENVLFQDQGVASIVGLLRHIEKPCHLIGHSFGATIAMRIANEYPELVKSLILFEPVFFGCLEDSGNLMYDQWSIREKPYTDLINKGDLEGASKAFMNLWGTGVDWADIPEHQRTYITKRIHLISACSKSVINPGKDRMLLSDYKKVKIPVYLLEGEHSPIVISEVQKTLLHTFPNALRSIIDGAGHMAPITHPEEFAKEVKNFIEP